MNKTTPLDCLVCLALMTATLSGATRTVTTLTDGASGSLRQIIAGSVDGDTIVFAVTGTIQLTGGELGINRDISIRGPGAQNLTISGGDIARVFRIFGGTVGISDLSIRDGAVYGTQGADGSNTSPAGEVGSSAYGGAIYNQGNLVLSNCLVSQSLALGGAGGNGINLASPQTPGAGHGGRGGDARGGAVYMDSPVASLTVVNTTFWDSSCEGGRGGNGGRDQLGGSFGGSGGNGGAAGGGAIYVGQGTLRLVNATFFSNRAYGAAGGNGGSSVALSGGDGGRGGDGVGGAVECRDSFNAVNSTLAFNRAIGGNGGFGGGGGTASGANGIGGSATGGGVHALAQGGILNTIIAGNTGLNEGSDVAGSIISLGHNLIGQTDGSSGWLASDLTGRVGSPLDPQLGLFLLNGGPTPNLALLPSSAAIDAGDDAALAPPYSLLTDQRGQPRRVGDHVDIGAVEFSHVTRLVTTLNDSGGGSLRQAIATAGEFDRITFASLVRGTIRLTSGELLINKQLTILGPGTTQLTISGNNSSRVFHVGAQGSVEMYHLTIAEGLAMGANGNGSQVDGGPALGGGIYNEGMLALFDCMLVTNRAQGGRGGHGEIGAFGSASVIPGNGGLARGGAIYSSGILSLTRCTLLGNTAQGGGGGDGGRDQAFSFFGNGGVGRTAYGGAVWSSGTAVRLENCTLCDNHARGGDGGFRQPLSDTTVHGRGGHGIGGALSGAFALESCSIAGNSANGGSSPDVSLAGAGTGGGVASEFQTGSSARNSVIARNSVSGNPFSSAPDAADAQSVTPWLSHGWNLIGITDGSSGWTVNDFLGNGAFPLNPLLGPCQDNGGPVWTMCPLSGSPLRDKGDTDLATDARGGRRVVELPAIPNAPGGNGADIGALEVDSLFRVLSIARIGAVARVRFKTELGNTYTLQQTSVVTNRTWINGASLSGNGQVAEAADTTATVPNRFYRVISVADPEGHCVPPPDGLVSWWGGEGNAVDHLSSNPGTLNGGLGFAAGQVGQAFNFTTDGQAVTVPASATLNVGAGPGFTIEGWINPADATSQMPIVEWNNGVGPAAHFWISVNYAGFGGFGSIFGSLSGDISGIIATGPGVIQPGAWQHVAMTFDRASGEARLYRNAIQVAARNLGGQTAVTTPNLFLGARPGGAFFRGRLDEVSLYGRALAPVEILALYNSNERGKCR